MFNMPCSRVGHVYRDRVPYKSNKLNAALVNFKRVAEVCLVMLLLATGSANLLNILPKHRYHCIYQFTRFSHDIYPDSSFKSHGELL